ncbi:MAG: DUF2142 domain-containing protein [Microbacteriaceae bacterium]|nr:DUF2142 domain-containing protein [Microbacteriaceae bacterium]
MRRVIGILLLPVLALVALSAWMFASPVGAAADDDYHLMSTWCANAWSDICQEGEDPDTRIVPDELAQIDCFAQKPEVSASCQDALFASDELVETDRGNWSGGYPPVYYAVMGFFAGPDIQVSALVMRFVTILLFLGITIALYALLPVARRPALLWGWLIATVPLGVFLLASNNPSSWSLIGVGSAFFALLGYFETTGRRRVALGAIFALSVVLAAGSRGDSAIYAGFAIAIVLFLTFARTRAYLLSAILPVAMGLVALGFFLSASQVQSGLTGFGGGGGSSGASGSPEEQLTGFGLLAYNLLNIPFLWSGVLGTWGLGWLDTSMPWVVPLAAIGVFVAVGFAGLGRKDLRGAIAVLATVVVLWALPLYVLQRGGDMVGEQVQPRYLFPLILLLAGLLALVPAGRALAFGRIQSYLIATALTGANLIALHLNIRRYVTGIDGASPNLDAGAEWWWVLPVGPTAVWIIGALAYGALVFLLVPRLAAGRDAVVLR